MVHKATVEFIQKQKGNMLTMGTSYQSCAMKQFCLASYRLQQSIKINVFKNYIESIPKLYLNKYLIERGFGVYLKVGTFWGYFSLKLSSLYIKVTFKNIQICIPRDTPSVHLENCTQ